MGFFQKFFPNQKSKAPMPEKRDSALNKSKNQSGKIPPPSVNRAEITQARYALEHKFMPASFFEDPKAWTMFIAQEKTFDLWDDFFKRNGLVNPYKADDFVTRCLKTDDDTILVSVELPKPERAPLCYMIHYVYNERDGLAYYYTKEREIFDGQCCCCGWTSNGIHYNMGEDILPPEKGDERYGPFIVMEGLRVLKRAGKDGTLGTA